MPARSRIWYIRFAKRVLRNHHFAVDPGLPRVMQINIRSLGHYETDRRQHMYTPADIRRL